MKPEFNRMDVSAAVDDLRNRTLARLPGDIARLIYLAGTRDYNSGRYYHDGLAFHFTEPVAAMALEVCHREVFDRLVFSRLEEVLKQLETYVRSTLENEHELMRAWQELGAYRVTVPAGSDLVAAALFLSNVKVALAMSNSREEEELRGPRSA